MFFSVHIHLQAKYEKMTQIVLLWEKILYFCCCCYVILLLLHVCYVFLLTFLHFKGSVMACGQVDYTSVINGKRFSTFCSKGHLVLMSLLHLLNVVLFWFGFQVKLIFSQRMSCREKERLSYPIMKSRFPI